MVCDLCFLMVILCIMQNLECVGDEVVCIVCMVKFIIQSGLLCNLLSKELCVVVDLVVVLLCKMLDLFVWFDIVMVVVIIKEDYQIDDEYNGFMCKFIIYIMEDF